MLHKNNIIILCSLLILAACNDEVKISFSETNVSTQDNKIVEVNIPEANGNEVVTHKINSEIQKIIITALQSVSQDKTISTSIEESISSFNKEYNTFKNDFSETQQWEAQIDGEVLFQSQKLISISITTYINTGGAHGALTIYFLNIEAETGNVIPNNKLFKDTEAFKKIASTHFSNTIADKDVSNINPFDLPSNMAYSEDGVVLLYNTYEIAPYSTGIIDFVIPFDEVEPYLVFNSF